MSQAPAQLFNADPAVEDSRGPTRPTLSSAPGTPTVVEGTPVDQAVPLPMGNLGRRALIAARRAEIPEKWWDRAEAFLSRLSSRDNFWRSVCSLIWLPLAFFSGLTMKQLGPDSFAAVLPFRRFNRNFYRAMAGGALLANSEIAAGTYVFGICGGDYTVVCKNLNYTFLRPCYGPAVYRMKPRESIRQLVTVGTEFNVVVDMDIAQQASRIGEKDKRVGRCEATFHVTPKIQHKVRALRKRPATPTPPVGQAGV